MQNLLDLGQEVIKIREAIDSIEVKGKTNASYLVYAYDKCNSIIMEINRIVQESNQSENNQNGVSAEEQDGK